MSTDSLTVTLSPARRATLEQALEQFYAYAPGAYADYSDQELLLTLAHDDIPLCAGCDRLVAVGQDTLQISGYGEVAHAACVTTPECIPDPWQIAPGQRRYLLTEATTTTLAYLGFSSRVVEGVNGFWVIALAARDLVWQETRLRSGLHLAIRADSRDAARARALDAPPVGVEA